MAIQFIDLCSGIGGFHSGLMATGHYECVGHAEIDPDAAKAYKATINYSTGDSSGPRSETTDNQKPNTEQNNTNNNQASSGEMVWIPKSGSKYHSNSGCSNMKNPTQVTKEEAESRGYEPCKKCY